MDINKDNSPQLPPDTTNQVQKPSPRKFIFTKQQLLYVVAALGLIAVVQVTDYLIQRLKHPDTKASPITQSFVQRNGRMLTLDGQPFKFIGFNRDNAATSEEFVTSSDLPPISKQRYNCGDGGQNPNNYLTTLFSTVGTSCPNSDYQAVVRVWIPQSYATIEWSKKNPNKPDETDYTMIDKVIEKAKNNGVRLIMTLENEWSDCTRPLTDTQDGRKLNSWYDVGYKTWKISYPDNHGYTYPMTYKEYVSNIVSRYKDEPTIIAWMLVNEAESEDANGTPDPVSLYKFAKDMSSLIKSIDTHHLVGLGADIGQSGTQNGNYLWIHSLPDIDIIEIHEYSLDPFNSLVAKAIEIANFLDKPVFIGEVGIKYPDDVQSFQARAELFQTKKNASFAAGNDGYLIWSWTNLWDPSSNDHSSYDVDGNDPICQSQFSPIPPVCETQMTCPPLYAETIKGDWENQTVDGWQRDYGPVTISYASEKSKNGTGSLKLNSNLNGSDGWDEFRLYKTFPGQNWSADGTDIVAYIYLPGSDDYSIKADLNAAFYTSSQTGPSYGLAPGMWNIVIWPNAPLTSVGKIGLKISTESQVYAGPMYLDYFHVRKATLVTPTPQTTLAPSLSPSPTNPPNATVTPVRTPTPTTRPTSTITIKPTIPPTPTPVDYSATINSVQNMGNRSVKVTYTATFPLGSDLLLLYAKTPDPIYGGGTPYVIIRKGSTNTVLKKLDGNSTYYFQMCYLVGDTCSHYSNQLSINIP